MTSVLPSHPIRATKLFHEHLKAHGGDHELLLWWNCPGHCVDSPERSVTDEASDEDIMVEMGLRSLAGGKIIVPVEGKGGDSEVRRAMETVAS